MSRLWRSFPPIYLILWLSKWLKKDTYYWRARFVDNDGHTAEWGESHKIMLSKRDLKALEKAGLKPGPAPDLPEPHDYEPTEGINYKKKRRLSK